MWVLSNICHEISHFRSKHLKQKLLLLKHHFYDVLAKEVFVAYFARVRALSSVGSVKVLPQNEPFLLAQFSRFLMDVLKLCYYFIAGFIQLDIVCILLTSQ